MRCPFDGSEMMVETYEADIEIDRCGKCGGVWLDSGELARVEETRERDYHLEVSWPQDVVARARELARQETGPVLDCPKCHEQMAKEEHGYSSQILIDVCVQCGGAWLDKGELKAIEVFFEKTRLNSDDTWLSFWGGISAIFRRLKK